MKLASDGTPSHQQPPSPKAERLVSDFEFSKTESTKLTESSLRIKQRISEINAFVFLNDQKTERHVADFSPFGFVDSIFEGKQTVRKHDQPLGLTPSSSTIRQYR